MPVMQKGVLADATTSNSMAESATATMMSSGMPTTEATGEYTLFFPYLL